jgi:hypothetical protein
MNRKQQSLFTESTILTLAQKAVQHYCHDRCNRIRFRFEQETTSILKRYYYTSLVGMHRP